MTLRPCLLVLALAGSGCGASALEGATRSFATAAADGAKALREEFDLSSKICRRRREVDFFTHRLESAPAWGAPPFWRGWENQTRLPELAVTWKQHCAHVAAADGVHREALSVVSGYAAALTAVIDGSHYDGADVKAAAAAGGQMASSLIAEPGLATGVKAFAEGAGDPLAKVAGEIMLLIAGRQLKQAIVAAAPHMEALMLGFERYSAVADQQLADYRGRTDDMLAQLDPTVKGDVAAAMRFYDLAVKADDEVQSLTVSIAEYRRSLAALRSAHASLVEAAKK